MLLVEGSSASSSLLIEAPPLVFSSYHCLQSQTCHTSRFLSEKPFEKSPLCPRKIGSKHPRALSFHRLLHARTCRTSRFLSETLFEGGFPQLRVIANKLRRPLSSHDCPHSRTHHPSCCLLKKQFAGFSLRLREIPNTPVSIVHKIMLLIISPHSLSLSLLAENPSPVSSGQTGGRSDVAMNAIQTSLATLKDGSALVANVPYISPIAGLLLQILTMRDVSILCASGIVHTDRCITGGETMQS